eukprot:GFUD01120963.1.p1 GENE.GFUD01120963.1~~GFUD01120963.1.p1  ORF type:complete len:288 (+),score=64.20 GFUD01120963.1:48-911(+)
MTSRLILCVIVCLMASVSCVQMDWGKNKDVVKFDPIHQGIEHIKLFLVLADDPTGADLECQVLLASLPVSEVVWKMDGKPRGIAESPIVFTNKYGETYIEDHWKLDNITLEMDGRRVSCGYPEYGQRVELILRIFKMEIEASEKVCDACEGNVRLVFKDRDGSRPGEGNVAVRMKSKIAEKTQLTAEEVSTDNDEYSVSLPISSAMDNPAILAMDDSDTLANCRCESAGNNWFWFWMAGFVTGIVVGTVAAICLVVIKSKVKTLPKLPTQITTQMTDAPKKMSLATS